MTSGTSASHPVTPPPSSAVCVFWILPIKVPPISCSCPYSWPPNYLYIQHWGGIPGFPRVSKQLLPIPRGHGPRLVDCGKHTPARSPSFKCTRGSMWEGLWGTRGLWLKPQDGSADCLTLKGSLNPETRLPNQQRTTEGKRKTDVLGADQSSEFDKSDNKTMKRGVNVHVMNLSLVAEVIW